jgi:hypothetical protein
MPQNHNFDRNCADDTDKYNERIRKKRKAKRKPASRESVKQSVLGKFSEAPAPKKGGHQLKVTGFPRAMSQMAFFAKH